MSDAEYTALLDQHVQAMLAEMRQETLAQRTRRQAAWRRMWTSIWQSLAIHLAELEPDVCSEAAEELALGGSDDGGQSGDDGDDGDDGDETNDGRQGDNTPDYPDYPLPAAIAH